MIRPIVHDPMFLMRVSVPATAEDRQAAIDLTDTLKAHIGSCVGLAANMIGINKRIIVFLAGNQPVLMLNPKIIFSSDRTYETEEGCLSLSGTRTVRRYERIEVEYEDINMKKHKNTYTGFTAQIIQHEIDHCNGVLI